MGDNFRSGRRMRQEEETTHWEENTKKKKGKTIRRTRQKERINEHSTNRWDYWTTGRRIHNDILEGKKKKKINPGEERLWHPTHSRRTDINIHTHAPTHTHTHLQWHFYLVPQNQKFWFCHFSVGSLEGAGSGGHVERNRDKVASVFGYCRMREIKKEKKKEKKKRITNKQSQTKKNSMWIIYLSGRKQSYE